jgi:Protein of unknown function (DUF2924)
VSDIASALAELAQLDRPALGQRWEAAFEVPAPKGCQATLLRQALAWHLQVQALGKAGARRSRKSVQSLSRAPGSVTLSPGTRLMREWQGQTHHVTVATDGFEYDGKTWRSLSAVARSITGTAWSGPVFFGVK